LVTENEAQGDREMSKTLGELSKTQIEVGAEREISAPAGRVYALLADYREHHPKILPPAFSNFRVEEGGVGAGTVVAFQMTAGGRTRTSRMKVTEPEPGRLLQESDLNSRLITRFTVTPLPANRCLVRIDTRWPGASGIGGFFERLFAPKVLHRVYVDELGRLDRYAQEQSVN
jgi:Polyketide cyclase / dehydrase and lipid transport